MNKALKICKITLLWVRDGYIVRSINFFADLYKYYFGSGKKLKKFHNIHRGERCFIVATGPSITYEDLDKIKNEYTFSMNSMVLSFGNTNWRPTYYGIQDNNVYKKISDTLWDSGFEHERIFVGSRITSRNSIPDDVNKFVLEKMNQRVMSEFFGIYYTKFSRNFALKAYSGYTITYSLIQLAYYMGFKEIYLLGCDCNYVQGQKQHFIEHGHIDPTADKAKDRMLVAYQVANEFCQKTDLKIFNATRGGMLEIFPRVNLDEMKLK